MGHPYRRQHGQHGSSDRRHDRGLRLREPGYIGTPEFSFGTFGPTDLTQATALAALGATTEGGFTTGNRVYSMQNVVGTQFFKVYTAVPEPSTIGLAAAGIAALGASAWRKRKLAAKAKA